MRTARMILFFFAVVVTFGRAETGLEHLNALRQEAGLHLLSSNAALEDSAHNHSHYLQVNNTSGHGEEEGKSGFTGAGPGDRAVSAGYYSRGILENVSSGQENVHRSIDGLMAAIYHRFAFLSLEKDEIGIGIEGKHYTFDMGSSLLNDLCQNHTYASGSYYYQVCEDRDKKIEVDDYRQAKNHYKTERSAPDFVLWPPDNGRPVPPAFYEETPDPLPDYEVSGYPVSVQINDARFSAPESDAVSMELEDAEGNALESITLMNKDNDPQKRFSAHQFALFPLHHMEWGAAYYATLTFDHNGTSYSKRWCFTTQSLADRGADRVYRIDSNEDTTLQVVSGRTYALYFVPQDAEDVFHRYSYRYSTDHPSVDFLDWNTLLFSVTGDTGEWVELTVRNSDDQVIKLVIADSDSAHEPARGSCTPSESNDTEAPAEDNATEPTAEGGSEDNTTGYATGGGSIEPTGTVDVLPESQPDVGTPPTKESSPASSSAGGFPPAAIFLLMLLTMIRMIPRTARA